MIALLVSDYLVGSSPGRDALAPIDTYRGLLAGVNVDHSSFRNLARFEPGIRSILSSDVLLYGSSKGLLGLRAKLLNDIFGKPGKFLQCVRGIWRGVSVSGADCCTERNSRPDRHCRPDRHRNPIQMSQPAIEAIDMGTMESATRAVIISARYQGDLLLSSHLPAVTLGKEGFGVVGRLMPYEVRDPDTGDDEGSAPGEEAYPIVLGDLGAAVFGPFGGLRDRVIPFLRCRNITIIAIAIPFSAAPERPISLTPALRKEGRGNGIWISADIV